MTVTTKISPDLDGVACAIGYTELLLKQKPAMVRIEGQPDAEARFV